MRTERRGDKAVLEEDDSLAVRDELKITRLSQAGCDLPGTGAVGS
jgi:hypothetical protein